MREILNPSKNLLNYIHRSKVLGDPLVAKEKPIANLREKLNRNSSAIEELHSAHVVKY